ncbi:MAG: VOC family protein [Thermomicrobiales bacterium]
MTTGNEPAIHPATQIGHVHLKVSNLEQSIAFYRDVLGFELTQRYGAQAAFLSAGGYHHHIGLNTWESQGGKPAPFGSPGLYHVAFLYPNRLELARAVRRALQHGIQFQGASDHGVSEALYFADPDGNGIEIYRDRARSEWPREVNGDVSMFTHALDLGDLLGELDAEDGITPSGV